MLREIVFIDWRVADIESILASLSPDIEVILISAETDGILQIAAALAGREGINGIHIISHGAPGEMLLGNSTLNVGQLDAYRDSLAAIGRALTADGDLLLYGCDVGQGEVGAAFVKAVADITGADVAASTNPTGSATLGGDWVLEQRSGAIETSAIVVETYAETLGIQYTADIRSASTSADGESNYQSVLGDISSDGRYVVFSSDATNLVAGDTNSRQDVFIKDMQTGSISRVSVTSAGIQSDGYSEGPQVSGDGRFIVFDSGATNLVAGDSNGTFDVFIKDSLSGVVSQVSTDSIGTLGNASSFSARVSGDGRYVLFNSYASNLTAGDTNNVNDIFVKDRQTGMTFRVSESASGGQANNFSDEADMSASGRYVAFQSDASNLVAGDVLGAKDIFMKDVQTGEISLVSSNSSGDHANDHSWAPSVSADGRYVVFHSDATNLVTGDTNLRMDVFIKDTVTGITRLVSTTTAGTQANGSSYWAHVSTNGRYVTFTSNATNLVVGDTNGQDDVFVKDMQTGAITRASTTLTGVQGNGAATSSTITDDGKYIAFTSEATNLGSSSLSYGGHPGC